MDPNNPVSIILTFLFTGGGLLKLIQEFTRWKQGKAAQEKEFNQRVLREARENDQRADVEARNRRVLSEYASKLLSILYRHGVDEKEIPPYPTLDTPRDE